MKRKKSLLSAQIAVYIIFLLLAGLIMMVLMVITDSNKIVEYIFLGISLFMSFKVFPLVDKHYKKGIKK